MTTYSSQLIKGKGNFPNNDVLPVIIYTNVFDFGHQNHAELIKKVFKDNGWFRSWTNGIYDFNHYHSNNHECLGMATGWVKVLLGGDTGHIFDLKAGDAVLLPAGTSHKRIACSDDFSCVGTYSIDLEYNMKYGRASEYDASVKQISTLPLPATDPIYGVDGPVKKLWKK